MRHASILVLLSVFSAAPVVWGQAEQEHPRHTESQVMVYPAPKGEKLSPNYTVEVDGKPVPVYTARVNDPPFEYLDHGGTYSFATFDFSGPVTVKIHCDRVLQIAKIRPAGRGLSHSLIDWHNTTIRLERPAKFSFEPNGRRHPLLIFANAIETNPPKQDDPNVIYFGPGIHRPEGGVVEVKSNQTLYVAGGAVLQAAVKITGAENAVVRGRGIICGNSWYHLKGPAEYLINIRDSKNVILDGVILRGSYGWTITPENCENVTIQNVKICGGRVFNDDGIDPVNSRHVYIRDCFIRTDDDCIALKGLRREWGDLDDIRVEHSILWADRALIVRLACESLAKYMQNLIFRDVDVVHFVYTAFDLMPGEDETIRNVRFEDFRIDGNGQEQLVEIRPTTECRTPMPLGHVQNVVFKNINVFGEPGPYRITIEGYNEEHQVRDVTLENVSIVGKALTSDSPVLEIGKYTSGITVAPAAAAPAR